MVAIGTKPDFYKQAPLLYWANKKNIPVICATTGQHFDDLLGYGIQEFKMNPLVDLKIKGDLMQKAVEIFSVETTQGEADGTVADHRIGIDREGGQVVGCVRQVEDPLLTVMP